LRRSDGRRICHAIVKKHLENDPQQAPNSAGGLVPQPPAGNQPNGVFRAVDWAVIQVNQSEIRPLWPRSHQIATKPRIAPLTAPLGRGGSTGATHPPNTAAPPPTAAQARQPPSPTLTRGSLVRRSAPASDHGSRRAGQNRDHATTPFPSAVHLPRPSNPPKAQRPGPYRVPRTPHTTLRATPTEP
jgi:hypothetical protein